MWNPNAGAAAEQSSKDVSLSDRNLEQPLPSPSGSASSDKSLQSQQGVVGGAVATGVTSVIDKLVEQESQSCEIDSGFLSGPQLSGYDDSEYGVAASSGEDTSKGSRGSPQQADRPVLQKQITVIEAKPSILDSGCLDVDVSAADLEDAPLQSQPATTASPMILDKKIDSGLTEWFCNLSLKNSNQPLNNLGCPDTPTAAVSTSGSSSDSVTKTRPQANVNISDDRSKQPWEIYYRQNDDGDTQLHIACITGYSEVVAALIRLAPHPCLLDIQNDEAQTALHLAVMAGQRDIARMLLVAGAQPTMRDRNGNTPLHLACTSGQMDCVQALTMPITASEIQEGSRALLLTKNEKSTILRRCTQLPPDLEQRNYDGERCVHLAAQNSHIDVLRYLVWYGADINAREGRSGKTPLHIAMETCNETLASFLLEECEKLDLEAETYAGLTAYQLAAINHFEQIANDLEGYGAAPRDPPETDEESDDDQDSQSYDRFGDPGYFVSYNNGKTINVA